ncbi:SH2 domain-containing protein 5 isoform X2 [Hirundo rustica]|uniref:SH2 domain-containing protein 5 isoform X2 n=1 Tax=Hirundo rustica TaxID=43150 RepID=UPI001A94793E|nr:SH2 domain-containing protein 5 isoform X2 [Hirundo rustica]
MLLAVGTWSPRLELRDSRWGPSHHPCSHGAGTIVLGPFYWGRDLGDICTGTWGHLHWRQGLGSSVQGLQHLLRAQRAGNRGQWGQVVSVPSLLTGTVTGAGPWLPVLAPAPAPWRAPDNSDVALELFNPIVIEPPLPNAAAMKKKPGNGRGPDPAAPQQRARSVTKAAEYVGSFMVEELDLQQRVGQLEEQLRALKDCPRRRSVVLRFSLQGLKVLGADGETLLMAHALRRILYSTWSLPDRQFAFVARNPQSPPSILFCHLFVGLPGEVQTLHLLLCRSFQLCYLLAHPEEQAGEGELPGPGVLLEPLNPEEVSRNVNALVSFRRLPAAGGPGPLGTGLFWCRILSTAFFCMVFRLPFPTARAPRPLSQPVHPQDRRLEAEGRAWRPGNPYCSPVLVRKKAIRSKVLRSGAYRDCGGDGQLHQQPRDAAAGGESKGARSLVFLPENESVLAESVWAFAGIARAAGVALLQRDVPGAFLLRPEPGLPKRWCLWVRVPCGVVCYGLARTHQGRFCVEHSNAEFASVAALLAHYSGPPGGCFCRLAPGRRNPGYEERDPGGGASTGAGAREAAWAPAAPIGVQHERG